MVHDARCAVAWTAVVSRRLGGDFSNGASWEPGGMGKSPVLMVICQEKFGGDFSNGNVCLLVLVPNYRGNGIKKF